MSNRAYNRGTKTLIERLDREAQARRVTARRILEVHCPACRLPVLLEQRPGHFCIPCFGRGVEVKLELL